MKHKLWRLYHAIDGWLSESRIILFKTTKVAAGVITVMCPSWMLLAKSTSKKSRDSGVKVQLPHLFYCSDPQFPYR